MEFPSESKYSLFVHKILKFYIKLLLKVPKWRDDPKLMVEEVKATGEGGITDVSTQADYYMQQLVKEEIVRLFPNWQFWGEEGEDMNYELDVSKDYLVINDPIEGTNNFRYRREEQWGSVLAVVEMKSQTPVIGIVAQPMAKRIFVGIKNEGAHVITYDSFGNMTDIKEMKNVPEKNYFTYNNSPHFSKNLLKQVQKLFALGTIALDDSNAAEIDRSRKVVTIDKVGKRSEVFVDPECGNLEPIVYRGVIMFKIDIDIAAAMVIAQELGQKATDVNGNSWSMKIRNAIFGRSEEDWHYLKEVYDKTL